MKNKFTMIIVVVVIVAAIVVLSGSMYTVQEDEYAFVLRFSKVEDTVPESGLHFKVPFLDTVRTYPRNMMLYNLPPSDVLTSDSKAMSVDSYIIWKISDLMTFYKSIGSTGEAQARLDAVVYNALKNVIGTMQQEQIISQAEGTGRGDLNEMIASLVKDATVTYGIEVLDVKIKRFDLPEENEQAVYRRMISDRNQIAEKYRAEGESEATIIRNNVDKQVNIIISNAQANAEQIKAEGESEYMSMLAEAYNSPDKQDFYTFMRALDALKSSLSGSEKTVILGPDSDLARILMNSQS
ncbi:MAG: protease modulator HflC [Eubacteriales bacterium]